MQPDPINESIGQQLRQARQDQNLSLLQISQATHIRQHYLEAMEAGDFAHLPSKAQARGFLRAYASYLSLDANSLLAELSGESAPAGADQFADQPASDPQIASSQAGPSEIFVEIGRNLNNQREMLGFSLDEVERNTRVRQHYLRALEAGDLQGLPSPVQGRGMLHNYATFLGLDPDPLLLRYADGLQAQLAAKQATRPRPQVDRPDRPARTNPLTRLLSSDFLIGGILVMALAAFIIWGVIRINSFRTIPASSVTVPSVAEALLETPVGSQEFSPTASLALTPLVTLVNAPPPIEIEATSLEDSETTPEGTPAIEEGSAIQLAISVIQRAWMRVIVDEEIEFEGRVIPGSAYQFSGQERIELLTGNGAALQIFFNQNDLGVLGVYGEVISRVFTSEGMLMPTPTITPTATETLAVTPTPEVTLTPPPTPAP
jgi:cytoskeleton protein RodZ